MTFGGWHVPVCTPFYPFVAVDAVPAYAATYDDAQTTVAAILFAIDHPGYVAEVIGDPKKVTD